MANELLLELLLELPPERLGNDYSCSRKLASTEGIYICYFVRCRTELRVAHQVPLRCIVTLNPSTGILLMLTVLYSL